MPLFPCLKYAWSWKRERNWLFKSFQHSFRVLKVRKTISLLSKIIFPPGKHSKTLWVCLNILSTKNCYSKNPNKSKIRNVLVSMFCKTEKKNCIQIFLLSVIWKITKKIIFSHLFSDDEILKQSLKDGSWKKQWKLLANCYYHVATKCALNNTQNIMRFPNDMLLNNHQVAKVWVLWDEHLRILIHIFLLVCCSRRELWGFCWNIQWPLDDISSCKSCVKYSMNELSSSKPEHEGESR